MSFPDLYKLGYMLFELSIYLLVSMSFAAVFFSRKTVAQKIMMGLLSQSYEVSHI